MGETQRKRRLGKIFLPWPLEGQTLGTWRSHVKSGRLNRVWYARGGVIIIAHVTKSFCLTIFKWDGCDEFGTFVVVWGGGQSIFAMYDINRILLLRSRQTSHFIFGSKHYSSPQCDSTSSRKIRGRSIFLINDVSSLSYYARTLCRY